MTDSIAGPLRQLKALLEDAKISYMIVGSYASTVHGEPRTTLNLDIVIDPSPAALDHFLSHIDMDAFYVDPDTARDALRRRAMFNVIDMRSAWKVDLVMRKDRPFSREELARRVEQMILGVVVPTASAEDTIVAKLEWAKQEASERQIRDTRRDPGSYDPAHLASRRPADLRISPEPRAEPAAGHRHHSGPYRRS